MTQPSLLEIAERPRFPNTYAGRLAQFFTDRPGQWIDADVLMKVAGKCGWRTRVSNCRQAFGMTIENRLRHVENARGEPFTISEYRYVP